ncbi:MAG: [Fe-Fe] hydrogenase large subunit C-terminal domain-containing protein [Bacteroidales bacterium]|nr:[Fe-Fe] hydrogenase large subunit C-terminal domain-containing protein [Bacteroidales bacterium]MDD3665345.1 [Fe-Fe] hydrogenase large subunit C-terminal domain-containing protein [Bacteroidales bacterium]
MENKFFHHALKVRDDQCIGCTHCMTVCPTEAIRVRNGKAVIIDDRCVDCGMCLRSCPVKAIHIEHDDFSRIFDFKQRIALVPSVLIGQFPEEISVTQIYSVLMELGFTAVYEVEHGVEILQHAMRRFMAQQGQSKPVISSFCPAVVRLIQVRFPALTENIMLLKPPLDIAAHHIKKLYTDQGIEGHEIGIFYITPCAAKIAAIKSPVGEERSPISGVINMDFIFNKIFRSIKQGGKNEACLLPEINPLTKEGVMWSLTHGEASQAQGRCLAIDEIHNVMDFLEKIENDEITDIDFLELRACDESCAGGVLAAANRFLTVERMKKRAKNQPSIHDQTAENHPQAISNYEQYLLQNISIEEVNPRSMLKLDEDMSEAMRKMNQRNKLMNVLPKVDCGACGAPGCQALAEDIVQGKAGIEQCFFIRNRQLTAGQLDMAGSTAIIQKIWGNKKLKNTD